MSQIITGRIIAMLFIIVIVASGCGTPNDQSTFDQTLQKHPEGWLPDLHVTAAQADVGSCRSCHGEDLSGGISKESCTACHTSGLSELSGCTSCHGNPPSDVAGPNRNGAHSAHYALPGLTDLCETCHAGAGTGTPDHFNGVINVRFENIYNAASGTVVFNTDGTCSNVSCHGGQTTPAWLTGSIDVNTQCTLCHTFGAAEYNSYSSGRHLSHTVEFGYDCFECHDYRKLELTHFASLKTLELEGAAAETLANPPITSYNAVTKSCSAVCHSTGNPKSWLP